MRILFLSDNFPPETNAPASRTHEHARAWVQAGAQVTVVTCAPNFPAGQLHAGYDNRWVRRETLDGIDVVRVKTYIAANQGFARRSLDYLSFMASGALRASLEARPDVVVATSPQFFAGLGGWLAARAQRRPFVLELRDLWPASIGAVGALRSSPLLGALERLELFLYRRAAAIVPVTDAFRRDLVARGIDPAVIHVIHNGVDLASYAPRPKDAELCVRHGLEGAFVVGYLGTHGLAHALEHVLTAAELLAPERRVRFLFAGGGAERQALLDQARARGLQNTLFLEPVPKYEMPRLWSVCDVALVHLRESPVFATVIPSKIYEAFGMGLPVLYCGPRGEASALIERERAGLCLPAEQPAALAQAVAALARDPARRDELARCAALAAPRYDRRALALEMLALLREHCAPPSLPSTLSPAPKLGPARKEVPHVRHRRRVRT